MIREKCFTPILLAISLVLVLSSICMADTVTLNCVADTCNHEAYPNNNYGDDEYMSVRRHMTLNLDRNCFVKFDLTGIPSGAVITQATLKLYQYSTISMTGSDWIIIGAYRLLKDWEEGTGGSNAGACWNYRYKNGVGPWSSVGARNTGQANPDRNNRYNGSSWVGDPDDWKTCTTGAKWVEFDVTPSAQCWHRNSAKNFGMVIDTCFEQYPYTNDDDNGVEFRTREYQDNPSLRPVLVVVYHIPSAQPTLDLRYADLTLNYWNSDPNITLYWDASGQLKCEGTTGESGWGWDGCRTNYTHNSSFETTIKVKLEDGVVSDPNGEWFITMIEDENKYIRFGVVGMGPNYYEVSGQCAAVGNGERHDGSEYWSSYWDDGYPMSPPSGAVCFLSETPSDETTTYITWKIRYDKTNQVFSAFVVDGSTTRMVAYYTGVNFSNWRLALVHANDQNNVFTRIWTKFTDSTPPTPNPMTWATQPYAVSTSQISMVCTTASDDTPPITYYFDETTGNPGGSSSGWQSGTSYTDAGLSANTWYGYRVKARDSAQTPNETSYSQTVYKYTLMPTPAGVTASNIQATTVDLTATGSFPNLSEGQSGVLFYSPEGGNGGINTWIQTTTDQATDLTPNTQYTFKVKARNGDAIETGWASGTAIVRTLASQPWAFPYTPVTTQSIRANWGANGNPAGTEYLCWEETTGRQSGWITDTTWVLTELEPNTQYRFLVKARNADHVETGWTDLGYVSTSTPIGKVKREYTIGQRVTLSSKVVVANFPRQRLLFVEDWPDITKPYLITGIAVKVPELGVPGVQEGDLVTVDGVLKYNDPPYDNELIIEALNLTVSGAFTFPKPVGCHNRGLGGGDFGLQSKVYDDVTVDPALPSYGLNVVGSLVKAWGAFSDGGLGGVNYFWVNDGSNLNDGNGSALGIRVSLEPIGGIYHPPFPQYVSVTGVMRCMTVPGAGGNYNVRVIWPRKSTDIVPYLF